MIENIQIEYRDNVNPSSELEAHAIKFANDRLHEFESSINEEGAIVHLYIAGMNNYRIHFSKLSDSLFHLISKRADGD